ncbi:MAG TPA: ABC-F family ATP-binding cassette domain-containing protein [Candidatus Dormibacteraeota bacterium]|jgi:ATP-binding cassette subfamily F protein 3|nr:ABC-F family ATP-binding cassette domain-containing protein [Candidatus Dormibacteraeota bacterium]
MPLITLTGVAAEYGASIVFREVDLALQPRQRLGIVGPNGAGKSTLLKLASGELQPAEGRVDRERRLRIGVLEQFDAAFAAESVLEQTMAARADLLEMRHELHRLEHAMAGGDHGEATMHRYGEVQEAYQHGDGYTLEARCREVLGGLGFHDEMLERNPRELSGGQRRRVQLAQMLLLESDVLLLDEPTNHLDLGSIEWLEEFLVSSPQAMLIVSHDRRFLDNVADSILELEAGRAYVYPGSYSKFVRLRADRRADQQRRFEAQQGYIAHQEAFIQRYKAGQRAREARGRATRLERLERVTAPPDDKEIRIRFGGPASAHVPLQSRGFVAGYPDVPLAKVPGFVVEAGARVAIVGPNGAGKTTILRTLQGGLKPLEGSVGYGARVQSSYYDQHLGDLPEEQTMVEVLSAIHPIGEESARHHLARLLFRGDDVFKRVKQLSGGERSRLAMARLMLDQANLLFLDEPTNHLDVPSQETLQEALKDFAGTLVFVSHDRELIDEIATHTWWLEDGTVRMEIGGYGRRARVGTAGAPSGRGAGSSARGAGVFVDGRGQSAARGDAAPRGDGGAAAAGVDGGVHAGDHGPVRENSAAAAPRRIGAEVRQQAAAERRARADAKRRVADLERAVAAAEAEVRTVEAKLADPELYRFPMEAELWARRHAEAAQALAELYQRWETAAAALPDPAEARA